MELTLNRIYKKDGYTIGDLYIDGEWFCNILEDKDRGLTQSMTEEEISKVKVYGQTAIPIGTYQIDMNTVSPKFKDRSWAKPYDGKIPRLINVPGFDGILIHPGNSAQDTFGCLLPGFNKAKGQVLESQTTFYSLMSILLQEDDITITIK